MILDENVMNGFGMLKFLVSGSVGKVLKCFDRCMYEYTTHCLDLIGTASRL